MNHITIELSAEDRARLDRIAELLERQTTPTVASIIPEQMTIDTAPVDTPTESTEKPADAQDEVAPITTPPVNETPTEAKEAAPWDPVESFAQHTEHPKPEQAKSTVTLEQIQQKVMQIATADKGAKKAKVRDIISTYGTKVSDLKEQPEKWDEVWSKLTTLEGEA